ncbi:MAG: LysM peptidoglycan-binding domain-containing protein, partial [Acidimicrobiales bacterium]
MNRLVRLAKGLGALVLLAALVVGIPWALWHFVGWPLPHHVPTAGQVGRALNHQGIPGQAFVDALAVVVWITWATLVASLAVELPAALSGRRAPRLPVAGAFQPLTGHLVAAVLVACLALAPRAAHTGPAGGFDNSLSASTVRRPVAALVVKDPVLAATTRPLTAASVPAGPAATSSPDPPPAAPAVPAPGPSTYVVQRGDTLWGIAQRQLDDPLQWQAIYQLNEGRPQPGGVTLTDPHWIDPGWTLLLPASTTPAPTTPVPATTQPAPIAPATPPTPASPPTTSPSTTTAPTSTTMPPPSVPTTPEREVVPSATNGSAPHRAEGSREPVRLPSGSVVAGSFAAGVLATVALGRLRRRHAYRYRPPEPGRDLTPEPSRPTLHHLATAVTAAAEAEYETGGGADPVPVMPFDDTERRGDPGRLDLGERDGQTVTVEITELSGVALAGPAVDDIARAVLTALVVRAGRGAAEVLLTAEVADRLLPGLGPDLAVR